MMRIIIRRSDIGVQHNAAYGLFAKPSKLAHRLKLIITGTLGILIKARKKNIITSIAEVLNKLKRDGFRLSEHLERETLRHDK